MATHSSIPAWKIPWTEEPGGLQSMESQRVGHDWVHAHTHTHTCPSSLVHTHTHTCPSSLVHTHIHTHTCPSSLELHIVSPISLLINFSTEEKGLVWLDTLGLLKTQPERALGHLRRKCLSKLERNVTQRNTQKKRKERRKKERNIEQAWEFSTVPITNYHCLTSHTVCWTRGRPGMSEEAGRKLEERRNRRHVTAMT